MIANSERTVDRILGCLIGGAIGDAWGSRYEGGLMPIAVPSWSFCALARER
jgi:hypothetical protein